MSNRKNSKIIESFENAQSVSNLAEVLNLQKNDPVITPEQLFEKSVEICGLGDNKQSIYDISVNIKKLTKLINQFPGYGYETVIEKLCDSKRSFFSMLVENIGSLNEALILFNEISDYETCISPSDSLILIQLDKKIGSFCLDNKNIRGIITDLSGFLKKDWKQSSRVEINKFYLRILEKFSVVFFIGIKNCNDFGTAVKYLECIYFNLPDDFRITDGMNKIITSEELINKFADVCRAGASETAEICTRVDKITNLIVSIEKENVKTLYFCDQLKKRAGCLSFETEEANTVPDDHSEAAGDEENVNEASYNDVLAYPNDETEFRRFYAFCKSAKYKDGEKSELFYLANAIRILIDDDLDNLPDPVSENEEAVMWGRSFYKTVYDSYFNETNQFYVLSSFCEGIPAVCKKISDFVRKYYESVKKDVDKKNFAAVCVAYPNAFSRPYYVDAEKAVVYVGDKNSKVLCDFIEFCLDNDFTQYPIIAHIVNSNSEKDGWEDAVDRFGEQEDWEEDGYPGMNRGIWFVVLIIILILAAGAYYFFFYSRSGNKKDDPVPENRSTVTNSLTTTDAQGTVASSSEVMTTLTEFAVSSSTEAAASTSSAVTSEATTTEIISETTEAPAKTTVKTPTTTVKAPTTTAKVTTTAKATTTTKSSVTTKTTAKETKPTATEKTTEATAGTTAAEKTTEATTGTTAQKTTVTESFAQPNKTTTQSEPVTSSAVTSAAATTEKPAESSETQSGS